MKNGGFVAKPTSRDDEPRDDKAARNVTITIIAPIGRPVGRRLSRSTHLCSEQQAASSRRRPPRQSLLAVFHRQSCASSRSSSLTTAVASTPPPRRPSLRRSPLSHRRPPIINFALAPTSTRSKAVDRAVVSDRGCDCRRLLESSRRLAV